MVGNNIVCIFTDGDTTCVPVLKPVSGNAHNSYSDVIESVVNAARNQSEDSRDSTCSSSDTKSIGNFFLATRRSEKGFERKTNRFYFRF